MLATVPLTVMMTLSGMETLRDTGVVESELTTTGHPFDYESENSRDQVSMLINHNPTNVLSCRVIDGVDSTLDALERVPVNEKNRPLTEVKIQKVGSRLFIWVRSRLADHETLSV